MEKGALKDHHKHMDASIQNQMKNMKASLRLIHTDARRLAHRIAEEMKTANSFSHISHTAVKTDLQLSYNGIHCY